MPASQQEPRRVQTSVFILIPFSAVEVPGKTLTHAAHLSFATTVCQLIPSRSKSPYKRSAEAARRTWRNSEDPSWCRNVDSTLTAPQGYEQQKFIHYWYIKWHRKYNKQEGQLVEQTDPMLSLQSRSPKAALGLFFSITVFTTVFF